MPGKDSTSVSVLKLDEFLQAYENLQRWQDSHLPSIRSPQGAEIWDRLLHRRREATPVRHFYHGSRFTEPTVRRALEEFQRAGLVTFEADPEDTRRRLVRGTERLVQLVEEYVRHIARLFACTNAPSDSAAELNGRHQRRHGSSRY